MVKKIILLTASIFFLLAAASFADDKIIRVNILNDAVSFKLGVKGSFSARDLNNNILFQNSKGFSGIVSVSANGIKFGSVDLKNRKIRIIPLKKDNFSINSRMYGGELRVILKDNKKLLLVNFINQEEYLKSVVPGEVPWYWPYETLKAQAIVARTFALYQTKENNWRDYDLTDSVYSQVYGGKSVNRFRATHAVEVTKGIVLTYKSKIFPAYFHSTCGGHTEDASNLWDIDHPSLKGVVCPYCKGSSHYFWFKEITKSDFLNKLKENSFPLSTIQDISVSERNVSGRVKALTIVTLTGETIISAKQIRKLLGSDIIKSLNFNIFLKENNIVIEGFGWGHGVGFCQWGGYFLAREGKTYSDILKFYYPGSELTKIK
jgi:stage II sporulation protein D